MVKNIKITRRDKHLSDDEIARLLDITQHFFPNEAVMRNTMLTHLENADSVRLAMSKDRIIGFSIASRHRKLTPFYRKPVNLIYARMLYLDPDAMYRGLGLRLLSATLKDLFGWFWPFRRMVSVCRTQNPVVAKIMSMCDDVYPKYHQAIPENIHQFAESLLPMLGAQAVDDKFRLIGTMDVFKGADYSDIWNRFLHRRNNEYEALMLESAFEETEDLIINSGAFVLFIAYIKPFRFIRYLLH